MSQRAPLQEAPCYPLLLKIVLLTLFCIVPISNSNLAPSRHVNITQTLERETVENQPPTLPFEIEPGANGLNSNFPAKKQFLLTTSLNYFMGLGARPILGANKPCRCGVRNQGGQLDDEVIAPGARILNGHSTRINEFPWRVSINPSGNSSLSLCAGALIASDWVLTSASCVHDRSVQHILVDLGDHNLTTERETENVLVSPIEKIVHENYVTGAKNNENDDIALLKLAEPIKEGNIMPVCLPRYLTGPGAAVKALQGGKVLTSGWGRSKVLKKAVLSYKTGAEFEREIAPEFFPEMKAPPGAPESKNVFTFDRNVGLSPLDGGTTMEHYDLDSGLYYAVGVANRVETSPLGGGVLGVWTDLTKYMDWLDAKATGAVLCSPRTQ